MLWKCSNIPQWGNLICWFSITLLNALSSIFTYSSYIIINQQPNINTLFPSSQNNEHIFLRWRLAKFQQELKDWEDCNRFSSMAWS
jgi:hypothetical protein